MENINGFNGFVEKKSDLVIWIVIGIFVLFYIYIYPKLKKILRGNVPYISCEKLKELLEKDEDLLLIDVRSKEEYEGVLGHVEQSINISIKELEKKLQKISDSQELKETKIIMMGRDEDGGYKAYKIALEFGFENIYIVEGGLKNWLRTGNKTNRLKYS
jgi:rhodanese-related sulfurtransferase